MRDSFRTPLIVEDMGKKFKLYFDFTYYWKRLGIPIRVRRGFVTDYASIPRIARLLIPKLGKYNKAAVIHDALYQGVIIYPKLTRDEADLVFKDAMEDLGVAKWKVTLMYWAVRLGGWIAWRRRRMGPASV